MFLVGLTGGIATGKSSVAALFRCMGIEVIDADLVAREVVEPGKKAWKKIRKEFGPVVFHADGQLNRTALGQIVFSQPDKRRVLNSITHPEIYKSIFFKCMRLLFTGHQFAVIDLPLLYESKKMVKYLHKVVVVACEPSQQIERLMRRDSITEEDALLRINAQMPLEEKCKLADYVIDNSHGTSETEVQTKAIITDLRNSKAHWKLRIILLSGGLIIVLSCAAGVWGLKTYLS